MKTLEQYFKDNECDHKLRADTAATPVRFYIHPEGKNGDTLDFAVKGNSLEPLQWQKEPQECGYFWWAKEDNAPVPVLIMFSGTDKTYFAPHGQHGWPRFRKVSEMGGVWLKIEQPERPAVWVD